MGAVTVPGKGGRPRKWRSDTERVRACRARQRGDAEPPTVEEAYSEGDELALAIRRHCELEAQLADARQQVRILEVELAAAEATSDRLEAQYRSTERDRQHLLSEVADLNERVYQLTTALVDTKRPESALPANRAARRRAARRRG